MSRKAQRFASSALAAILAWHGTASCARAQLPVRDTTVQGRVAAQLTARLLAAGAPALLLQRLRSQVTAVDFSILRSNCRGVDLLSVRHRQSLDDHPLIVARSPTQLFLLGGFTSPEILQFAAALDSSARADCTRSSELIHLLDPHGAIDVAWIGSPSSESRERFVRWRAHEQTKGGVLADTSIALIDGSRAERVTVLSRSAGAAPEWTPVIYVFVYDARNELIGWSHTAGQPISP